MEQGSQEKEGDRSDHAVFSSRLKDSSVGALNISVGSLFHEIGGLHE